MKRILIVDEERISVSGTVFKIETNIPDVQVLSVKTCSDAIEMVDKGNISLIVLDMMIPRGAMVVPKERIDYRYGIDLLIEWRVKRKINIPIVCYTIINSDNKLVELVEENDAYFLCKLAEGSENRLVDIIKSKLGYDGSKL